MKERIIEFLRRENKTSSQFAEEIGVQPSSISHIISGRNNPSLDFVLKMLQRYRDINSDWLLFGTGPMRRSEESVEITGETSSDAVKSLPFEGLFAPGSGKAPESGTRAADLRAERDGDRGDGKGSQGASAPVPGERVISRVLLFYSDRSFEEYSPVQ